MNAKEKMIAKIKYMVSLNYSDAYIQSYIWAQFSNVCSLTEISEEIKKQREYYENRTNK